MNRRAPVEAEFLQTLKIEALGELAGRIAHDFNNYLAVLHHCLGTLSGRQTDDWLQARVALALRTIERAEQLTGQLLAFARRQPSVARIDVNVQLRRMTELLACSMGNWITIETELAPDLWPVDVDPAQLELAIINLAINARDAMPSGGRLHIRTANSAPGQNEAGGQGDDFVVLEISDTGTGMPSEVAARAFDPFFTTKKPSEGAGLGLSIVYNFARQASGTATIRTEVGRGTHITLRLRRSREHSSAEHGRVKPARRRVKPKGILAQSSSGATSSERYSQR
jgi:signal transduction histidine kinase